MKKCFVRQEPLGKGLFAFCNSILKSSLFYATFIISPLSCQKYLGMKKICLPILLAAVCFFSCKKESHKEISEVDGYVYTDGDPAVVAGGIGWYFAESRVGSWKALPLQVSELPVVYKPISTTDSIAVTVSLRETNEQVNCDCVPGAYHYYHIISIRKR